MNDESYFENEDGSPFEVFNVYKDGTILKSLAVKLTSRSVFMDNKTKSGLQAKRWSSIHVYKKRAAAYDAAKIRAADNVKKARIAYENAVKAQAAVEFIADNRMEIL